MKLTLGNLSFLSALFILISVGAISQNTEKNYSEEIRIFFISQKQFEVMPSYESSLFLD